MQIDNDRYRSWKVDKAFARYGIDELMSRQSKGLSLNKEEKEAVKKEAIKRRKQKVK